MELHINSEFPINYLNQMKIMANKIFNDKRKTIWNTDKLLSLLDLCVTLLQVSNFNTTITTNIKYNASNNIILNRKKTIKRRVLRIPQTRLQTNRQKKLQKNFELQTKIKKMSPKPGVRGGKYKTRKQRK
jgi:hypothetical protein